MQVIIFTGTSNEVEKAFSKMFGKNDYSITFVTSSGSGEQFTLTVLYKG